MKRRASVSPSFLEYSTFPVRTKSEKKRKKLFEKTRTDTCTPTTPLPFGNATYDQNGNLSVRDAATDGILFEYDDENQLTDVIYYEESVGLLADIIYFYRTGFIYDGLGRLRKVTHYEWETEMEAWVEGDSSSFIYDGRRAIQERDAANNTPQVSYTRGSDLSGSMEGAGGIGGLLARSHGYSSGSLTNHNFYHADGNGNITYMINSSQTMVAQYRYDPFGNTLSSSGDFASANVYRFSSKEFHVNSGMYYYGYRWYAPNLQRWLNRDPLGDFGLRGASSVNLGIGFVGFRPAEVFLGPNLYTFVKNNSISGMDPLGLEDLEPRKKCSQLKGDPEIINDAETGRIRVKCKYEGDAGRHTIIYPYYDVNEPCPPEYCPEPKPRPKCPPAPSGPGWGTRW